MTHLPHSVTAAAPVGLVVVHGELLPLDADTAAGAVVDLDVWDGAGAPLHVDVDPAIDAWIPESLLA